MQSKQTIVILLLAASALACAKDEEAATDTAAAAAAAGTDQDIATGGQGVPAGYVGRTDRDNVNITDASYTPTGNRWEVKTGPAHIIYAARDSATGSYTVSTTVEQMAAPAHPEAFGRAGDQSERRARRDREAQAAPHGEIDRGDRAFLRRGVAAHALDHPLDDARGDHVGARPGPRVLAVPDRDGRPVVISARCISGLARGACVRRCPP
jgi:hypothetical protein